MTRLLLAVVVGCTVTVCAGGLAAAAVDSVPPGSEVPMSTESIYRGTTLDSEHAFALTVTLRPTERVLANTTLRIQSTRHASIDFDSVNTTVRTAGGDQVVENSEASAGTYQITQLEPGESVAVQVLVYPERLRPAGEQLAVIRTRTRFASNERIVEDRATVAPTLSASEVAVVDQSGLHPLQLVGGVVVGALAMSGLGAIWWRHKRAALAAAIDTAVDRTVNRDAERKLRQVRSGLGGSPATSDTGAVTGPPDTTEDEDDGELPDVTVHFDDE